MSDADDPPLLPALVVFEPKERPRDTGLVDQHGRKLFRQREKRPIGFVRLSEISCYVRRQGINS